MDSPTTFFEHHEQHHHPLGHISFSFRATYHILLRIIYLATLITQSAMIDYYLVAYKGLLWTLWAIPDTFVLAAFLYAAVCSYNHLKPRMEPEDLSPWRKQLGDLPMSYITWFLYSTVLVTKICIIYELPDGIATKLMLADFNQETLAYTSQVLKQIKRRLNVPTSLQFQKKSVHQLIKESMKRRVSETAEFDFIYCAGLFDYLSHQTCRQLMDAFYDLLAPGGLLLATNVENSNPLRHGMQHLLDWPLIYRDAQDMRALSPGDANGQDVVVSSDATGVNLFIEVRKPEAG